MKINSNFNFALNQAQNQLGHILGSAPTPSLSLRYFNSVTNCEYIYDGSIWVPTDARKLPVGSLPMNVLATDPLARANHSGTQLAATISDLASTVQGYSLSSFSTPLANIGMGGFTLTGLATPNAAGQAAEYNWVIGQIQASAAGIDAKPSVRAYSATNHGLSGLAAIDGVTPSAGDRILLGGQTTASENGPYIAAAGAWTRATDTVTPQAFWLVEEGTTYGGSQWKVATTGVIVTGTTPLSIVQFGAGSAYSNGNGLNLAGSTFSIKLDTASWLTVGANGLAVDKTAVAGKYSVDIGDGAQTTYTITHNLNTLDVITQVRLKSTGAVELCDIINATVNTVTVSFSVAPALNSYRVTCLG